MLGFRAAHQAAIHRRDMSHPNAALRRQLEDLGDRHDAETVAHDERLLNITPDTGAFLAVLVRAARARRILEIGTSNGYSTLWLAEAAHATGGQVTTVEHRAAKAALARTTFARAAAIAPIHLEEGDGGEVLAAARAGAYDFIFLDADRAQYVEWWPEVRRALRNGGVLVVDNAVSHASEVAAFVTEVAGDAAFTAVLVPIGKGEFVACKDDGGAPTSA
jgi:predicted O-methyltransferase YrrM